LFIRKIQQTLENYLTYFPAVLITGARQVGKTTLTKELLTPKFNYVLLEDLDTRELAIADPRRFLEKYPAPVIFDEFQLVPELTSYLQGAIDQKRTEKGRFVLTGSQNFLMMEQVSQSLAGRIGILVMYGLSSNELPQDILIYSEQNISTILLRGAYPELWTDLNIPYRQWYSSYVQTYLQKDLRMLTQVIDLNSFERFLKVCALRTAQTLNLSEIAQDSGISPTTATRWLSLLESTFIIKLVHPYYTNLTSRVKKTPKIYFMDTGLACYLMGIQDINTVLHTTYYGALFETLVYSNFIKIKSALGSVPTHSYLQTKSKVGVDLIIEENMKLTLVEIKATKTLRPKLAEQLALTTKSIGSEKIDRCLLVGLFETEDQFDHQGVTIQSLNWSKFGQKNNTINSL